MSVIYPPAGEAHVYIVDLDAPVETMLDEAEKQRFGRFHRPVDAGRYAAAHSSLRHVLAGYLGSRSFCYSFGPFGKPRPDPDPGLAFSLSRSGPLAAIAVAGVEVGVDIERIRDDISLAEFLPVVLSVEERQAFCGSIAPEQFYRLWVRKEAILKARGVGLNVSPDSVQALAPEGGIYVFDVDTPSGFACSLAATGPLSRVRTFSTFQGTPLNKLINDVVISGIDTPRHSNRSL